MRRIEARRRKASAFRVRFSKSLANRRQRLTQAKVLAGKVHEVVPPLPPGGISLSAKKHIPMAIDYDFDGTSAHMI